MLLILAKKILQELRLLKRSATSSTVMCLKLVILKLTQPSSTKTAFTILAVAIVVGIVNASVLPLQHTLRCG